MKINVPLDLLKKLLDESGTNKDLVNIIHRKFTEITITSYKDIKSFEDACHYLGKSEIDIFDGVKNIRLTNQLKLETVIEALNEGWKTDFNNINQKKYYNYFNMENGLFVFLGTGYNYGLMSVPSALYLKDEETAIYCKDNFFELYKEYYGFSR